MEENLISKSVRLCEHYRKEGYACSEAVSRVLDDIYHLDYPKEVYKVISVFSGGGIDDGRCGIVEAGMLALAILYDREELAEGCALDELAVELHRSFTKFYGGYHCRDIFYPLYDEHVKSRMPESEFRCAFHEGITLVMKVIEKNRRGKKQK